ncbi:PTS sugar transporter subunit IIA [Marinilactibacillus sp. Marseille-P9653]|uniref:PTS sugar transporter subunit IIA n=1 Tax=Marinilactibacillus sp. Marseille-P9653 TaxID=2866583 RepID=UPI001CE4A5E2|nr:fructose PTS transporter subunit IIA [Marinilactibacillus sp. Marseille-P9653]
MEVKEILDVNLIKSDMKVETKEEALNALCQELLDNGYISDIEGFKKDVYAREQEGKTGIGNFIAIPHGKSAHVDNIGVAIGINDTEIPWESLDDRGVKGIILFAVGNDNEDANQHLKLLSLFARKLGNDEVVEELLKSTSPEEVIQAFS